MAEKGVIQQALSHMDTDFKTKHAKDRMKAGFRLKIIPNENIVVLRFMFNIAIITDNILRRKYTVTVVDICNGIRVRVTVEFGSCS